MPLRPLLVEADPWLQGLFYGGYGAVMIPSLGIVDSYGGLTPEFYNAFGFFILGKSKKFQLHQNVADSA